MSFVVNKSFTNRLRKQVREQRIRVLQQVAQVHSDAVAHGALVLQDDLEAAVTNWGDYRSSVLGRGTPGRHDTGEMVGSISYEGEDGAPFEVDGDRQTWAFGWFAGDFQDYFYAQDVGTGNIPAANAMENAYDEAKKYVRQHMPAAIR